MVSKRLATAVLVTGALHSGIASALGVGELSLESALNQPFRAEIPLRDVGELDVEQIRIALADASAFENAGVERSQFLSALQFHVELQRGGRGRIIVTTEKAVQEPYLDFIVEVRWPNGKMNREYTVLLDLPVFAPTSSASSVSVASASKVTKPTPLAEPSQREQGGSIGIASREAPQVRDVAQQQMLPKSKDATEYRVQHHDTMWKISQKLRPSAYVTTQQTMLALLKKNPKAFVGGNVNRIKSGYVLRIPSEAEVQEINQSQAVNEIRAQAREWRGEKVKRSAPDKKAPAETKTTMASASAPQLDATDKSGRSPVAAQDQAVKFSVGSAGSDASASNDVEALRQKVREEQENLDKTLLENEAMQTRVVEMEKQIRTLQSLITLKNSQLAALQGGVAGVDAVPVPNQSADMNVQSDDASIATSPESEAPSSEANSAMVADTNLAADKGVAEIANSSVEAAAEPIAEIKPESAAVTPDTMAATAQEWFSNGLVKYIGLGLAVLALLVLIIRRKTAHSDEEADLAAFEASLAAGAATEGDVFAAEPEALDFDIGNTDATELNDEQEPTFSANDFDFDDIDVESADVDGAGIETKVEVAEELESDIDLFAAESDDSEAVQPQTGDIVAEADIYVAYGRYDQAASLLKTAISQDPDNADLQVKLADIYLDTRDRESFIEAYTGLQSLGDVAAIARVKESMSAIDGVSDWLDAEDDKPAVNTVDLELDGDFD
ncbi:MAG: tetratricopeptide repeat protein, partial [Zhongshania sp.]|uniref:FimV/HubP family polar landmark protein n=1 Tax=Zhongshania sp. TaxID=1971902 RepID=UPI00261F1197